MLKEINGVKITGFRRDLNLKMWERLSPEQVSFLKSLNKEKLLLETSKVLKENGFSGKLLEDKVVIVEGEILVETDMGLFKIGSF